jgi:hypothetical protein
MYKLIFFLVLGLFSTFSGEAMEKIIIGFLKAADDSIKIEANILAGELNKSISDIAAIREVGSVNEANIILINKVDLLKNGFSAIEIADLDKHDIEGFGITGKNNRIFITGNSSLGIQHGVSKYLFSLGFRYYFPRPEWFIYPKSINYYSKINLFSSPSFKHRYLWYGFGPGTEEVEYRLQFWNKMNCLNSSLQARIGHSYDLIAERNKSEFFRNPAWIVNTVSPGAIPPNPKFDVSKNELVNLVIRDTREQIQQLQKSGSPAYKMISLSPSDGVGFCNTPDCRQLGSVSDRVFHLVNSVAKNIRKDFPNTLIGCLAYSEYISPPDKPIEDNVYVSLTTAFNNSKFTLDELIGQWRKKVKKLGIYDYMALYTWDYDMPGQSLASAYHLVQSSILKYKKAGIVGYEAEINTGWINKGLGYYITSQLLWNPEQNINDITDEFFNNCFQSSASSIKKLYYEWSRFRDPFIGKATISRWIDILVKALEAEKDAKVISRLGSMAGYLQYLTLYTEYKNEPTDAKLATLMNRAKLHMNDEDFTYYPAMIVLGGKLNGFNLNEAIRQNKTNLFTFSAQETIRWLKQYKAGIKKQVEYAKPSISKRMGGVPGASEYKLSLHDVKEDRNSYVNTTWFVFEKKKTDSSFFEMQADFIEGGGFLLPVTVSVFPFTGYQLPAGKYLIQHLYTDRKKWNRYSLASLPKGLFVLKVEDPKKGFQLRFSPVINYSLFIPEEERLEVGYIHSLYFYVPSGTKSFRFIKSKTMRLIDPLGKEYDYMNNKQDEIEIFPSPQQAGIWRLMGVSEFFKPEGIYPIFGIIPSRMLYPIK